MDHIFAAISRANRRDSDTIDDETTAFDAAEATSAQRRYVVDLHSLEALEHDEPLLPLVPDVDRDSDDYLARGVIVG